MKKILCLVLTLIFSLSVISCHDHSLKYSAYDAYDPYYNIYKEDAPTSKKYSVSGKTFYFDSMIEEDMMIRDKDGKKQVEAERSLAKLYNDIKVVFTDEDTVEFNDIGVQPILKLPATKGVREKNILTVKYTNPVGRVSDIRIEIHEEKIIVIHDVHTYDRPGMYATITFRL